MGRAGPYPGATPEGGNHMAKTAKKAAPKKAVKKPAAKSKKSK